MNEAGAGASERVMPPLPPADLPLTAEQRALLLGVDGLSAAGFDASDAAELRAPGLALRALLDGARVDLVDGVFDGLASAPMPELAGAFAAPVDVADAVLAALALPAVQVGAVLPAAPADLAESVWAAVLDADSMLLSAFADGEVDGAARARVSRLALRESAAQAELQAHGRLAARVQDAVVPSAPLDLWGAIADGIGADAGALEGSEPVGQALRQVLGSLPPIDVAPQVLASVSPAASRLPRWASLGAPLVSFALAALVLLAVVPALTPQVPAPSANLLAQALPAFQLSVVNDAQVEDLETSKDVVAQVVQFDEGGPTFILVDEPGKNGGTL